MTLTEFLTARLDEDEASLPEGFDSWYEPDRYGREVEAKRAVMALHEVGTDLTPYARSCGDGQDFGCLICHEWDGIICGYGWCPTLRHLAAVYADHPDYREEWRP